jgi:tetratricopeptide (TPR) repeat protein
VRGNNEFHARRFEAALAHYSAGLALGFADDPFRAILHANRAAALQALRQYCDAVMDCCASALLDPGYLRALQRRADAYLSMGDWPSAVRDLEALAPHMGSECTSKLHEARRKVRKGSTVDHYAVLGLEPAASTAAVKQSYRQLALKHHPDKASKSELRDVAEALFKHVAAAYTVLSDVGARKRYDSSLLMARFRRGGGF